ncbi:NAD(P)/FAD-dependent oxidoreductase [Ottowia thiooxydans]|uniref:NAD(P)/FAD-dependent oxidoreductase n=1 Tax=Ottowia thiooxydans TaxID=219182 RepID=UPI0004291FB1|nr:FAD/NAD(P)-binding oxidoreductase [Ottowia thiooxydans]
MANPVAVIVGAGPAGTRAAEVLVAHGLRPIVLDESPRSGGQIYRRQPASFRRSHTQLYGFEASRAERLHRVFDRFDSAIDHRPGTLAWAITEGQVHTARHEDGVTATVNYDVLFLATGAMDRIIPVPGWTLPGVYTLGAAQVALKYQGCAIGQRCVFMGTGPLLYLVAYQYHKAGAEVAAVLDTSGWASAMRHGAGLLNAPAAMAKGLYYVAALKAAGVPIHKGVLPLEVQGQATVRAVRFSDSGGRERTIECSAVGLGYGLQSETQLADLAGCTFAPDSLSRQWLPQTDGDGLSSVSNVYLCGDGARVRGADYAEAAGALAALSWLQRQGRPINEQALQPLRSKLQRGLRFATALQRVFPVPHHLLSTLPGDTVVCRCENITLDGVCQAPHGPQNNDVNRTKALVRVGMGRCQGRVCGLSAASAMAQRQESSLPLPSLAQRLESIGRIRGQAPVKPLPVAPSGAKAP